MCTKGENFFHDIAVESISGSIVILDIDGTLVCPSSSVIEKRVISTVKAIAARNTVYVFSNNFDGGRSRKIAKDLDLPYIEAPYKKPNSKILTYIDTENLPIVMIGDKYLTDGLFAHFTQSAHIRVRRYVCVEDSLASRAACLFDDGAYFMARLLCLTK